MVIKSKIHASNKRTTYELQAIGSHFVCAHVNWHCDCVRPCFVRRLLIYFVSFMALSWHSRSPIDTTFVIVSIPHTNTRTFMCIFNRVRAIARTAFSFGFNIWFPLEIHYFFFFCVRCLKRVLNFKSKILAYDSQATTEKKTKTDYERARSYGLPLPLLRLQINHTLNHTHTRRIHTRTIE